MPNKNIETKQHENEHYEVVESSMQGWRRLQEDAHVVEIDGSTLHAGVFDGHGGAEVSTWVGRHIMDILKGLDSYKQG